ncbi:hypothetical protein L1887_22175 [Cichorium endivia]|nr:hypothetical protein L1887_22175 [Cichorium endivia]
MYVIFSLWPCCNRLERKLLGSIGLSVDAFFMLAYPWFSLVVFCFLNGSRDTVRVFRRLDTSKVLEFSPLKLVFSSGDPPRTGHPTELGFSSVRLLHLQRFTVFRSQTRGFQKV